MTDLLRTIPARMALLALVTAVLYGATLGHGFVWDDAYIIVNNPQLERLQNIPRFFLSEDTIEESTGYYRPLTYVSFALERAVWGVNPAGYHLTNLLLQVAAVLLFFRVAARLAGSERAALWAALVFALHPIAGETVNFLAGGRNTLLAACFGLLSLLLHLRRRFGWSLCCFTIAVFAKEFALLLPAVYLWLDWRRGEEGIAWRRYLLFLPPVACYLLLRSVAVQKANFLAEISLSEVMKAPYLAVRMVLNLAAPVDLRLLYEVQPGRAAELACLALLLAAAVALYRWRRDDAIVLPAAWMLLFLLPVVNIIPLRTITQMADRYVYFSLMGFALLAGTLLDRLPGRKGGALLALLAVAYAGIGLGRTGAWHDEGSYFLRMSRDAPGSYVGFKNLGMYHYRRGDTARALPQLAAADTRRDIPVSYLIGNAYIYWKEGELVRAERALLEASAREPYNAEPLLMLMLVAEQQGDRAKTAAYRARAAQLVHGMDEMLHQRAEELCRAGEKYLALHMPADAEIFLWQSLRIEPSFVPALVDLGSLKAEQGDLAAAADCLQRALAAEPGHGPARFNLAQVYRLQGRTAEAQRELDRYRQTGAGRPTAPAGR